MKRQPLYVLHPGWVASRFDGDRHYITAGRLAALYGVKMGRCVIAPDSEIEWRLWIEPVGAIHLWPRHDGNYVLPVADKGKV